MHQFRNTAKYDFGCPAILLCNENTIIVTQNSAHCIPRQLRQDVNVDGHHVGPVLHVGDGGHGLEVPQVDTREG